MSIWISTKDQMPPINEEVLILYKDKKDELKEESWIKESNFGFERWSYFIEYSGYYEVVYWTPLVDMPRIKTQET